MVARPVHAPIDSEEQRAAIEAARERFARYKTLREEHVDRKIERTRECSRRNLEQARILRDRYNREEH